MTVDEDWVRHHFALAQVLEWAHVSEEIKRIVRHTGTIFIDLKSECAGGAKRCLAFTRLTPIEK